MAQVLLIAVLHDQESVRVDQPALQEQLREFTTSHEAIGRIGENKIVLLRCLLAECEHIGPDRPEALHAQVIGCFFDEPDAAMAFVNGRHVSATARNKLEANAAGPRKQIKHADLAEMEPMPQNAEQGLFRPAGGGAHGQIPGRCNASPPVSATYDTHTYC